MYIHLTSDCYCTTCHFNYLDNERGRGDVIVQDTVERPVHSVVHKVHESGCGLLVWRRHGNLSLADDIDREGVSGAGKETTCHEINFNAVPQNFYGLPVKNVWGP